MIVAAYKGSPSSEGPPFIRQVISSRATMIAQAFAIAGVSISRAFDSASSQSVVHAEERLGFPSRNPLIHLGQRQRRQTGRVGGGSWQNVWYRQKVRENREEHKPEIPLNQNSAVQNGTVKNRQAVSGRNKRDVHGGASRDRTVHAL